MNVQILTLFLVVGITFLASCSNDNNSPSPEQLIDGTWYLTNVSGGLASISVDYQRGDIKWIFNQTNNSLTVENYLGNDDGFMLNSGVYDYSIEQKSETQIIFVDEDDYRMVILSMGNNLIITDDLNDGFTAEFKR